MSELPSNREVVNAYDEKLAEKLLKIADVKGIISASEFSSQLFNWAGTNLIILQQELDLNSSPSVKKHPHGIK